MILDQIVEYKGTFDQFCAFLKSKKLPIEGFVKLPFEAQLGYFITFIESKNINILCDNMNYVLYYNNIKIIKIYFRFCRISIDGSNRDANLLL